ncbi:hypothetical protein QKA_2403 [Clostridioides difficile DA00165]|nr:hypothetical protein QKA_2403 [Clostridioides difficile DA00165]
MHLKLIFLYLFSCTSSYFLIFNLFFCQPTISSSLALKFITSFSPPSIVLRPKLIGRRLSALPPKLYKINIKFNFHTSHYQVLTYLIRYNVRLTIKSTLKTMISIYSSKGHSSNFFLLRFHHPQLSILNLNLTTLPCHRI